VMFALERFCMDAVVLIMRAVLPFAGAKHSVRPALLRIAVRRPTSHDSLSVPDAPAATTNPPALPERRGPRCRSSGGERAALWRTGPDARKPWGSATAARF
jgi:hypothetical protein